MKRTLVSLALIGVNFGLFGDDSSPLTSEQQTFYQQLAPDAQKKFLQLDEQHRKAAMEVLNSESKCSGEHECSGQREKAVEEQYQNQIQQREQTSSGMGNQK